MPILLVSKIRV